MNQKSLGVNQHAPEIKPYQYTVEKLTTALDTLVAGEGDARARLCLAYFSFHTLQDKDFPPEHQKKWKWIQKEMNKYGPLVDCHGSVYRGSVENTMKRIRNSTASKIIRAIYELYWVVSENEQYR